jgi:hypothetical protein
VPRDVSPADGDIEGAAGSDLDSELTQASAHAAREPDRDLGQDSAEVLGVEPLVKAAEPVQEDQVTGPSRLASARPGPRWGVYLYWKRQELAFGQAPEHSRDSRIQEPHNGFEHAIGSKSVASVNPENALIEAEHDRAVGMSEDAVDISETEHG